MNQIAGIFNVAYLTNLYDYRSIMQLSEVRDLSIVRRLSFIQHLRRPLSVYCAINGYLLFYYNMRVLF